MQGYASAPSVAPGATIDFHLSVAQPGPVAVAVRRVGSTPTTVHSGLTITATSQPAPIEDPETGLCGCDWSSSWTLAVPVQWKSGLYLAEFTAAGARASAPFVVRDDERRADLCVVLPFATYQAENRWGGRSLSYGPNDDSYGRAVKISFDRPYAGDGLPAQLAQDQPAIAWLEGQRYDAVYATDVDLHTGRVDLSRYAAVVFPGTTAYWSRPMREALNRAVESGTSAIFLSSRNLYWHVRFEDRVLVCYKDRPDPEPRATIKWRITSPGPGQAEQELLGTQFVAEVPRPMPLVVSGAEHWFWAGTGLDDGDQLPDLVAEVADGHDQRYPTPPGRSQTLLATSPLFITDQGEPRIHHASICEGGAGGLVFCSGTPRWARALADDERIRRATANLIEQVRIADGSRRVGIALENRRAGSGRWSIGHERTRAVSPTAPEIEGYASATSVAPGSPLDFHVRSTMPFTITVHRIGHYGGLGSRLVAESGEQPAMDQPAFSFDEPTRRAECDWKAAWRLDVHEGFTSGLYLAVFTTMDGHRAHAPFVVTDPQSTARIGVVLPFLTYQANNRWPLDGVHGTSLSFGYVAGTSAGATFKTRALEVSFDRPFTGLSEAMLTDIAVISWLERQGHDITYLSDVDVHAGRVEASRFGGLLFPGQHEYWTRPLRDWVSQATRHGVSVAFLGAATAHWRARLEGGTLACYKFDPDPVGGEAEATTRWRAQPELHEQLLVGTGLIGRTAAPADLSVCDGDHWVWAGTGVAEGTGIEGLVAGQVDGIDPAVVASPSTVLASSPFALLGKGTTEVQTTVLTELPGGAFVFSAGTQEWSRALAGDARIQGATGNLLRRMVERPVSEEAPRAGLWRRLTGLRSGKG